ncbi:MAG TPA: nicotinate phosphoribosyltransferase [Spirochaetia bacterium]|nr:nicotinate phosphoribosyltransferase [Spirochaetia bacterium]
MTAPGDPVSSVFLTDFYELTMAQLYFKNGLHENEALFDYFFRNYPNYGEHQAGYCIQAGMACLTDWMNKARFGEKERDYLSTLCGRARTPLFTADFLSWLGREARFERLSLRAIPEGRVVHPHAPLATVTGPLAVAQLLETSLLNHLNYQTLIATKAARIKTAAGDGQTIDFGLRRGQGEGANAGARAALIGGVDFTSNVGVSRAIGLSPKGTHAHSLVQAFMALGGTEEDAFAAYADLYPDDCLLLVDTVNTLESGLPHAIKVFEKLMKKGHRPLGIRLDSGDLAYLAVQAVHRLDRAGFPDVQVVLSNQLDELVIWQITSQIRTLARQAGLDPDAVIGRLSYGIGTNLITSKGAGALDGVYKLTALRDGTAWKPAIKLSDTPAKTLIPGDKQVWRIYDTRGKATADVIAVADEDPFQTDNLVLHHPFEHGVRRTLSRADIREKEPLLVPVDFCQPASSLERMRQQRAADMEKLDPGVMRLLNPHIYHVSLTERLLRRKNQLIRSVEKNQ